MSRLALATCAALPALHHDDRVLLDALAARAVHPRLLAWDDPSADWSEPDLVVIRSTWDYAARRDMFVAWAERVAAATRLWNPADVVAWNTDKRYLRTLADAGVPVVPTRWAERREAVDLAEVMARDGWERGVVKPVVSSGSRGTVRFDAADAPSVQPHLDDLLTRGDAMIQPYLPSIEATGEVSVVWIDGAITHAVRKRPEAGDFRVQEQYGGREERIEVDAALRGVAASALRHAGDRCRYARVDVVRGLDGTYQLMELELVEPQLFLRYHHAAAERLAEAIVAALLERPVI
jgi:glutathione synthase/RimK-type ligase-like ATP-grasp enzyme